MMTWYKVLRNGRACNGGEMEYSLPTDSGPGEWHHYDGPVEMCYSGFHVTTDPYQHWFTDLDCEVYVAEIREVYDSTNVDAKAVTDRIRLLYQVRAPEYVLRARRFVDEEVPSVPWFRPDGDPRPEWRLFTAPSWDDAYRAAAEAAQDAMRRTTWVVLWDDPYVYSRNTAMYVIDRAGRDAVQTAAWRSARSAINSSMWEALKDSMAETLWGVPYEAAARDAALYAITECVGYDLPALDAHREHVRTRWDVWRKGYGLMCDAYGELYVYGKDAENV